MPQHTIFIYLLPLSAIILVLALNMFVLILIKRRLISLRYDQNKLSECLRHLGIGRYDDTQTRGAPNPQIECLSQTLINKQEKITELITSLQNQLNEVSFQLSELSKLPGKNTKTEASNVTDYEDLLARYLRRNFPSNHAVLKRNILLLSESVYDPVTLKNQVIETVMNAEFNNMSDVKKADFCQYINDCLARQSISIFTPQLGQEYDDKSMSLQKQLSASQKVSRVLYFGVRHNNVVILKADVHVG